MPTCYVMVGLPGLGKSYHVNKMLAMDPDAFVYSTDNLIEEWAKAQGWSYDFAFSKYIDKASKEAEIILGEAIRSNLDVIWDQTNLGVKKRKRIVNRMKQAGYDVECVCICPPEPTHISDQKDWVWRLKNREGKTIPSNIMTSMCNSYVEPNTSEGFKKVTYYTMHGALLGTDYNGMEK